jgi:hypothetical protein
MVIRKAGEQEAGYQKNKVSGDYVVRKLVGQAPPYVSWIPACAGMTLLR